MIHDIFVSYAHIDDQKPTDSDKGWVTYFVEELKKVLTQKLGRKPDVWMDYLLAENYMVEPELKERIRASRTMVLFMSPSYLNSKWCQDELGDFLTLNSEFKNKESVFIVAVEKTERESWHNRLRALTPIQLYTESLSKAVYRLGYPQPPMDGDNLYWTQLNELAHLITIHVQTLETSAKLPSDSIQQTVEQQGKDGENTENPTTKPIVWIAQPTSDLHAQWEGLASAIRQRGATVLPLGVDVYPLPEPDSDPKTKFNTFNNAANKDINKAGLLIQLLSAETGSFAKQLQLQALLAKTKQTTDDVAFLQWRAADIELSNINDAIHRELLQGTLACGFEQFRQIVLEHLDKLLNPKPITPVADLAQQSLTLWVTAGPKDSALAEEIAQIISDLKHAALPIPSKPEQNQSIEEYNDGLRSLLADVNGVILAHSQENNMWFQGQLAKVRKALANRAPPWGAFIDGPPAERKFIPCYDQNLIYLDCRNGLQAEPIQHFIDQLLSAKHVSI